MSPCSVATCTPMATDRRSPPHRSTSVTPATETLVTPSGVVHDKCHSAPRGADGGAGDRPLQQLGRLQWWGCERRARTARDRPRSGGRRGFQEVTGALPHDDVRALLRRRAGGRLEAQRPAARVASVPPGGQLRVLRLGRLALLLPARRVDRRQLVVRPGDLPGARRRHPETLDARRRRLQPAAAGLLQVLRLLRGLGARAARALGALREPAAHQGRCCPSASRSSRSARSAT